MTSLREYARSRGVSLSAVQTAIRDGRLVKSVVATPKGNKISDVALADAEWSANTRQSPGSDMARAAIKAARRTLSPSNPGPAPCPPAPAATPEDVPEGDISYSEARRRHEIERMRLAALKAEHKALELATQRGQLINADEARAYIADAFTNVKSHIRGVPTRFRQRVPGVTNEAAAILADLIDDALIALADGTAQEDTTP